MPGVPVQSLDTDELRAQQAVARALDLELIDWSSQSAIQPPLSVDDPAVASLDQQLQAAGDDLSRIRVDGDEVTIDPCPDDAVRGSDPAPDAPSRA